MLEQLFFSFKRGLHRIASIGNVPLLLPCLKSPETIIEVFYDVNRFFWLMLNRLHVKFILATLGAFLTYLFDLFSLFSLFSFGGLCSLCD